MSYVPFTVDGSEIPPDAPRGMGMTDDQAQLLSERADGYRETVMHLHCTVTGRDVELTAANCPPGLLLFNFGDSTGDVEQRIADGETPAVTHTYPSDGVFWATVRHENSDRAQLEVAVNFPPDPEVPA